MTKLGRIQALRAAAMLALAAASLSAAPALARTNHALLVAVTQYPNLPQKTWLVGPNHDAVLVRDYLTTRAPVPFANENVTVLADGVEGAAASPTRERILAELAGIAGKVERGDFVYLHMSGHGAQEPERVAGSETDGLNEIFLPADTSKWVDRSRGVPNALVDDDIGSALDAIRDKGAFVWIVIDACHSGGATRAAPVGEDFEVSRKLEFEDIGVPLEAVAEATAGASGGDGNQTPGFSLVEDAANDEDASRAAGLGDETATPTGAVPIGKGGMVAFFAAQTIETTPEMPLPKGDKSAEKYGLFTYTIMSKLAQNPRLTYRQLGRAVLQQYAADSRQRPTPNWEGDVDAPVFATESGGTLLEWPLTVDGDAATLPAGRLHRLAVGTKLAIMPPASVDLADATGYVEVTSVQNLSSKVRPVAHAGKPAPKLADLPAKSFARLAEIAIDFKLKVARPAEAPGLEAEVRLANETLDALVTEAEKPYSIELVAPGDSADLRFAVVRESEVQGAAEDASDTPALWFLPSSGELSLADGKRPPLVAIDTADTAKLRDATRSNLERIFRATSLSRLAAASSDTSRSVSVEFRIKRQGTGEFEPLDGSTVPMVHPGDEVHVKAENLSRKIFDINVLYIGSDYSISHMDAQRLVPGANIDEGLIGFTDTSFGLERMVAVVTEAPPLSEIEDLKFLEQGGVPPATRAAGEPGDFTSLLTDIGLAPATRAAVKLGDKGGQEGQVMIFSLQTEPLP